MAAMQELQQISPVKELARLVEPDSAQHCKILHTARCTTIGGQRTKVSQGRQ
jgi:hypothetical protein